MSDLCPVCGTAAMNFRMEGDEYKIVCDNCQLASINLDSTKILYDDDQKYQTTLRFPKLVALNRTRPRIHYKCAKCSNNILIAITDPVELTRIYVCGKCGAVYDNIVIDEDPSDAKK